MLTALMPVASPIEPVRLRATLSFSVKAPPRVTAPRLAITLAWLSVIASPVLAVSVPAVIAVLAVCVTAPLMSPRTPSVTVPAAPVVRLPSTALLALRSVIAAAEALVVVSVLSFSAMGAPRALTLIVPLPALTLIALLTTTPLVPPPVRAIAPPVVVSALATVRPAPPISAIAPLVVLSEPVVASVPVTLPSVTPPLPVLMAVPGRVSMPLASAVRPVFAPSVSVVRFRLLAAFTATPAPVLVRVTAPVKSLPSAIRLIEPVPASTEVVPPAVTWPVVWLTPRPTSVTFVAVML